MKNILESFNNEQITIIRRKYNEYVREFNLSLNEVLEDENLKHFIYRVELELGSKSFDVDLNSSENELFCMFIESSEYSNELVNLFKDTIKEFQ